MKMNNYRVSFTRHSMERAIERFKALSIMLPTDEQYMELALDGVRHMLDNPFMDKYIQNLMLYSHHENNNVLVYDEVNKMIYALAVKPYESRIVVKTIGTKHDTEWLYDNKYQRLCWIYPETFKFSTSSGNVTWY